MIHSTSPTRAVGLKQGQAANFLHGLTRSSLTCPLMVDQMNTVAFKVGLACCARAPAYLNCFGIGSRIAQVRVIFKLPALSDPHLQSLGSKHLAYIEWFSPFRTVPELHHNLYKVTRDPRPDRRQSAVIEVSAIRQSVQLFPCFSGSWRVDWTSDNVLEECDTFFINSLQNRQTYLTIS